MDQYFKSYEELDVHRLMLDDTSRTLAYKNAIFKCADKFKDKVVIDVGAGTGILSIFCAQAGAKTVYAVEASELAKICKEVVTENNLENVIEVIHSKVEDLDPNNIQKVDVIVSEWMGFYLVHEGMFESVLFARDHFLREGGILFPSVAKLYAAPCQLSNMFQFWDNVYGVNMKCIGKHYRKNKSMKPEIALVNQDDILGDGKLITWLDLETISLEEINILGDDEYVSVCNKGGLLQGICIWFSVEFPDGSELSTGPMDASTHWKQTIIVLPVDVKVEKDEPVAFHLEIKKDTSKERKFNIEFILLDAAEVEHEIPCFCYMTKCIVTRTYLIEQQSIDITKD
ncbi:PREDICTED: protein arginine N-methyltransferase 6 isoform X1 [Polistes dominula]|uniref:Protein arginine N-methyltransferase 6 isoform X1 n=1 Tax=Polistes dominula TaxID=743375 RepID=A0ABM1I6W8_POLDO|nr:PREDICTED: protein arginine N-methyltransferase 6 isoform X1 [Polistes dominula]